jgi:ferredoxin
MRLKYLSGAPTLEVIEEKCTACGDCVTVCPHQLLEIKAKKVKILDLDLCMECGACMVNCDWDAIRVNAGVGCASAIINGMLTGKEASCDPGRCNC